MSVTALLCLSAPTQLFAQGAEPGDTPPAPPPRQRLAQETPLPPVDVVVRPRPPRRPQPVVRAPAPAVVPAPVPAAPPASTNYLVGVSGAGRSTAPLIDTPQSVTVVPQQIIREQASSTVMDALRNVPGITFRAGEGGAQGDVPYIRGFDARNDIFRDGVRDPGWYTRDSFSVDSVEVLKGPSSFMFGRGSTGGVINLNTKWPILATQSVTNAPIYTKAPVFTKAPTAAPSPDFVELTVTGHTGPGVRTVLDANQQLGPNAAGRIQVMGQRYDIPDRDKVEENRWGVAPSFTYKFNEQTRATLSYVYQHDDSIPDRGIPYVPATWAAVRFPANAPRNVWYGITSDPNPDTEVINAHVATFRLVHEFTKDIKVTNTTRYVNVDRLNRATLPNNFTPAVGTNLATFLYRPGRQWTEVDNELIANNTDLSAKFDTGMLRHHVVAGVDVAREERSQAARPYTANSADATNFFNPNSNRFGGTFGALGTPTISNGDSFGAYLADQTKINQYFEVLGGVRFDRFDAESGPAGGTILSRSDDMWSWRVGGIFHPWENASLYAMRGTSFNPSAEFLTIAANAANLAPEENETTEIGFKTDVLNRRLSLTAAVFRTDKTNARVPDPDNLAVLILAGLTRVEGIELGAIGRVTDQWQVFAGYTHLRSEIVSHTTPAMVGKELLNTPHNAFSLWTTYDVTPEWTVGGGAFYVDAVWANADNTTRVPSYWRLDAMTSYKVSRNWLLQLNLYNLTNEYYFAQVYNNWAVPGAGRSAALTLRGRW